MIDIVAPTKRECERCGRQAEWDENEGVWRLADGNEADPGRPHCLHEWDINGTYNPVTDE